MTEFARIDPEGKSDRELLLAVLDGMHATHQCVDNFRAEQAAVNTEARKKRHAVGNAVSSLQGDVKSLRAGIGELKATQEVDSARITTLAKLFGAAPVEKGEAKPKGSALATWGPVKTIATIGGSIAGIAAVWNLCVAVGPTFLRALDAYFRSLA